VTIIVLILIGCGWRRDGGPHARIRRSAGAIAIYRAGVTSPFGAPGTTIAAGTDIEQASRRSGGPENGADAAARPPESCPAAGRGRRVRELARGAAADREATATGFGSRAVVNAGSDRERAHRLLPQSAPPLLEQAAPPPVVLVGDAGRAGEDRRGGVLDVLVEHVVLGERLLDRDEAGGGVALVGDEEQAGVEAAELVGAVDEGVAAPQGSLNLG
jgi:hypothetical protein